MKQTSKEKGIVALWRGRTVVGMSNNCYQGMVNRSKRRGHSEPSFSKAQLLKWFSNQRGFVSMFNEWTESNFDSELKPSADRINNLLGYTLNNIQLKTIKANVKRSHFDNMKSIVQLSKDGDFMRVWESCSTASIELNISRSGMANVICGITKTSGGFIWMRESEYITKQSNI